MRQVHFSELRRERPTNACDSKMIHFYVNTTKELLEKVEHDTLFLVVSDSYGLAYAFDITKSVKKYTSGKMWTPKMIDGLSRSFERQDFILNDFDEVEGLTKIIKQVTAECGM